jgi:hypothetical protein
VRRTGRRPYVSFAIEALSASTRFISRNQQDALALRIKGKGHAPFAAANRSLLHVGVAGAVERVNTRTIQPRPKLLEQARQSKNFCLHVFWQIVNFWLELIAKSNPPMSLR